jgi:DHA1 family multidrug resistance protein-like MFS transporter
MLRRLSTLDRDLVLICISLFLWGLGAFLYTYIQPLYLTQLGATPEQVGLALGLGGLLTAVLYAPIGLWADRRGRKGVILAGWSVGTAAGYGFAFAPDWRWFIPAMAAYTLSNFAVSVLNGYIAARTTPEQRAFVFALISMGFSAGSITAPAIGGWIGDQYGLRTVYFVAAVIFTLSTLSMLFIRPQPAEPQATASSARATLRDRTILIHLGYLLLLYFASDVGQILAPKFLEEVRGLTVAQIGWLGTISAIGTLILAPLISRFGGGSRWALAAGQLLTLVSLGLLARSPALAALMVAFFCGGGSRLVRAPTLARFANLLTPTTLGFGLGLQQTASQFGLAFSPYVAGLLYAHNPAWPFYAGMLALAGTLGMTVLLPGKVPAHELSAAAIAEGSSEPAS